MEEIAKSQSRSQLIHEIEVEDADNLTLDDFCVDGKLDKQQVDSEDESFCKGDARRISRKNFMVQNFGEILLELQKPKLDIEKFDGDLLRKYSIFSVKAN